MKGVQPMSPAAYDDELAKPRPERCNESCEGLKIFHSSASFDEAMDNTIPDQIRLFFPPRRVRRHVYPDLQHVARGHAPGPNQAAKHGLHCRSLPDDEVGSFSRFARPQVLPGGRMRWMDAQEVDI